MGQLKTFCLSYSSVASDAMKEREGKQLVLKDMS